MKILSTDRSALQDSRAQSNDEVSDAVAVQRGEQRALSGCECEVVHVEVPRRGAALASTEAHAVRGTDRRRRNRDNARRSRARGATAVPIRGPTRADRA